MVQIYITPDQLVAIKQIYKDTNSIVNIVFICSNTLYIFHTYGFFSGCSVILNNLREYYNNNKRIPDSIDCSTVFRWYTPKSLMNTDIRYEYFDLSIDIDIPYTGSFEFDTNSQFINYKTLDFKAIQPFITKYFSPSKQIKDIVLHIETKYNIDYTTTCVLFYRGNDKITETTLSEYNDTIEKAKEIQAIDPHIRFLIQSDETEYIEKMINEFGTTNTFYCKDEIRHMTKRNATVDHVFSDKNYEYSKYFLALTIIMSKCKYIISGSNGNCSQWIALYRGNADNFYQYPNPIGITYS
jgi:hypothetical protein